MTELKSERKETVTIYTCLRCSHEWQPRDNKKPRICPKCKSPYWDVPKKK